MNNLFEMMQAAQGGQAMQNLARQYGLSQQQTQAAIDALLPAFSMGLRRQAQDPYGFGNLMQMMTATPYGRLYDADGDGIPDKARGMGTDVLSQIFGSKEVSQAVAAQAAATSGVSQAILKQMMPVIAAMLMGGLFKSTSSSGLGGMLGQLAEAFGQGAAAPQGRPQAAPQPNPANPLEAILGGIFGSALGQAAGSPGANPRAGQPAGLPGGDILGQILGGMFGGAAASRPPEAPEPAPRRQQEPEPAPPAGGAGAGASNPGSLGLDALNQMFEHGRAVQDQHQDALKSILDAFTRGQRGG